jgi:hypothetical protein
MVLEEGGYIVIHRKILHFCIISTNQGLVFASKTCDTLTGLSHKVDGVVKRIYALL